MLVNVGGSRVIKNAIGALVPPGVVTLRVWLCTTTPGTTRLAVSDVLLDTTTFCTVMAVPPMTGSGVAVIVVLPTTKLVPVMVTATVVA
jgi:hypothetical protein